MFDLVDDFFGRKKECVVAGISGGEPPCAHEVGRAPIGVGRTLHPRGQVLAPPDEFLVPDILKYSRKSIFNFQGIWRTFIFGVFFIALIIQKTDRKILFLLYLI